MHSLTLLLPLFAIFLSLLPPTYALPTKNLNTSNFLLPNLAVFLNLNNSYVLSPNMTSHVRRQLATGTRGRPSFGSQYPHDPQDHPPVPTYIDPSSVTLPFHIPFHLPFHFPFHFLSRRSRHPFPEAYSEEPRARIEYCYDLACNHCSMFNGSFASSMCLSAPSTSCIVVEDLEDAHISYWAEPGCSGDTTSWYRCGMDYKPLAAKDTQSIGVFEGCGASRGV